MQSPQSESTPRRLTLALSIQSTCEYNSLSLKIYTLVNNDYVVVSSQAQMTATVILLPGVLGECLAVLIVL